MTWMLFIFSLHSATLIGVVNHDFRSEADCRREIVHFRKIFRLDKGYIVVCREADVRGIKRV